MPCPAGWISRPGAITILGCSIELKCPLGQGGIFPNCTRCSPGTYRGDLLDTSCLSCRAGRYQEAAGAANCTGACPVGTFSSLIGLSSVAQCQQCVAGTFAGVAGSLACAPCPEGSYEETAGRWVLALCDFFRPSERVSKNSSLSPSLPPSLPPSLSPHSSACKTCPTRNFANAKGLAQCKVCQPGTMFDSALLISATANPCASCPAGRYRDNNRTESEIDNKCTECGLGKASAGGSSACTECAAGKTGPGVGTSDRST